MQDLSVSYIFGQAWELTKKNFLNLVLGFFLIVIVELILMSALNFNTFMNAFSNSTNIESNPAVSLLTYIISSCLSVGFLTGCFRICRNEGTFNFNCYSRTFSVYLKYICTIILISVIIGIGFVLLIIPGIYLTARLMLAPVRVIDNEETGIIEALKYSWNATNGHALELIGLGFIALLVGVLGYLACCIGIFVAAPVIYVAHVLIYLVLKQMNEGEAI